MNNWSSRTGREWATAGIPDVLFSEVVGVRGFSCFPVRTFLISPLKMIINYQWSITFFWGRTQQLWTKTSTLSAVTAVTNWLLLCLPNKINYYKKSITFVSTIAVNTVYVRPSPHIIRPTLSPFATCLWQTSFCAFLGGLKILDYELHAGFCVDGRLHRRSTQDMNDFFYYFTHPT